jgi:hypothetical protein
MIEDIILTYKIKDEHIVWKDKDTYYINPVYSNEEILTYVKEKYDKIFDKVKDYLTKDL